MYKYRVSYYFRSGPSIILELDSSNPDSRAVLKSTVLGLIEAQRQNTWYNLDGLLTGKSTSFRPEEVIGVNVEKI